MKFAQTPLLALLATFTGTQALPPVCPDAKWDNPEVMCTTAHAAVLCGENDCWYSNACWAESAGFDAATECYDAPVDICPEAQWDNPEVMCTTAHAAVLCGEDDCWYSNACWAESAGFDAATECYDATFDTCPEAQWGNPEIGCNTIHAPVTCGADDCWYSNACWAESAGFDPATECTDVEGMCPPEAQWGQSECSSAVGWVRCGTEACEYSNACWAESAGFDPETECREVCPYNSDIDCPIDDETKAYECGVDACLYMSACEASASGFDVDTECTPAVCPEVPEGTVCHVMLAPMECGADACYYGNDCLAKAAGYDLSECVSVKP